MSILLEPTRVEDLMLYETDQRYVRREVTFRQTSGSTATYEVGQGLITSSAKRVPVSGDTIDAILLKRLVNIPTATDVLRVPVLIKGPAIINENLLVLASGHEPANKTALVALGIRLIDEPTKQQSN